MYHSTHELIDALASGQMVILQDNPDRENEGDLIISANHVQATDINFMITQARGLVCLAMTEAHAKQLQLMPQSRRGKNAFGTAFYMSIEAAQGVSTGISAADRAKTVRAAAAGHAQPADIVTPGHVFPVVARPGGVLMREGHTEAVCDLLALANLHPVGVMCEILNEQGDSASTSELMAFAQQHELKIGTVSDLVRYRQSQEKNTA